MAASVKSLQDGEVELYKAHRITDDEHVLIQEGFKTLYQTDKSVRQCIYTTNTPECVDAGIDAVNNFVSSKANGIKNESSRQTIEGLAQAVILSLNTLKAAL